MRVFASHSEKRDLPRNCILRKAGVGSRRIYAKPFTSSKTRRLSAQIARSPRIGGTGESGRARQGGLKPSRYGIAPPGPAARGLAERA